jgi:hypothetical protein
MATPAQLLANRANAAQSTGPRTPEGKAASAQNRTAHGLAGAFHILACEDPNAYQELLEDYTREYRPATASEHFLVAELAQAQWRILRADAIEAELLSPGEHPDYAAVAAAFRDSDALTRLARYAQNARRAYYKAQQALMALARDSARTAAAERRRYQQEIRDYLEAPPPTQDKPVPVPLPPDLRSEYEALLRRDPDFDPARDASQMSKRLRRWFERQRTMAA